MTTLNKTIFFKRHEQLGAKIVEFGGWEMPIQYPDGILAEHIKTREKAGIFDVSHMGRIVLTGNSVVAFLQYVLSNNAQALEVGQSQYTLIQNETGGALDDAYLYRFKEEEYLLVVNASNREKDLAHLSAVITQFPDVKMKDKTFEIAMISLQGPLSKDIMEQIINEGYLPEPTRNCLSTVRIDGSEVPLWEAPVPVGQQTSAPKPKPKAKVKPKAAAKVEKTAPSDADKPALLTQARDGKPDDLKKISGIGPKLEKELNGAGVFHFDQIASWTSKEVAWADKHLVSFKGRISRDNWVKQAKDLAT